MSSALKPPTRKGFALSANEEDRKKWTERLDQELPHYKQSKREIGRILKELKAVYCRPGCQGLWKPFLESRGLAMSTANDLIARYNQQQNNQGDSPQPGEEASRDRQTPSRSMQMKLTILPEYRDEFKQAVARLGRDRASEVIFTAVIQAVAEADMASDQITEEPGEAPEFAASSPEDWVEFTGSGKFNVVTADCNDDSTYRHMSDNTFNNNDLENDAAEGNAAGGNAPESDENYDNDETGAFAQNAPERNGQFLRTDTRNSLDNRVEAKTSTNRKAENRNSRQEGQEEGISWPPPSTEGLMRRYVGKNND